MRYEVWLNLHLGLLACLISRPQDQRGGFRFDAPYCSAWLVMHGEAWVEEEGAGGDGGGAVGKEIVAVDGVV